MTEIAIRRAGAGDASTVIALLISLAEYEKLIPPDARGRERLSAELASVNPRFEAYLAETDGKAIGYAIVFETYGSFRAKSKLYLEDLFILPEYRGRGAGKALFEAMVKQAREFYRKMGGRRLNALQIFQMEL